MWNTHANAYSHRISHSHLYSNTNGNSHTDSYADSHSHADADTHGNGHAYSHTNAYLSDDYLEPTEPSQRDRGHLLQSHHYSERRYFSLLVPSRKRQPAAGID